MGSPHDALFRCAFGTPFHARGWLQSALPAALAAAVEWDTLAPLGERAHGPSLRAHMADLVFTAQLQNGAALLLIVEHKSRHDASLWSQLLRYSVHLRRAHRDRANWTEPLVAPVVLQHGTGALPRPPAAGLRELSPDVARILARAQPHQRLFVDDLFDRDEAELRRPGLTPFAQLVLLVLRFARELPASALAAAIDRWGDLLAAVELQPGPLSGKDALDALGCYLLQVTEAPAHVLHAAFERNLIVHQETIMSTADRLLREGHARGLAEGKLEGKLEGQAEALLRQLGKRFGPLPRVAVARVRAATPEELHEWIERVLDAKDLDGVFAPAD